MLIRVMKLCLNYIIYNSNNFHKIKHHKNKGYFWKIKRIKLNEQMSWNRILFVIINILKVRDMIILVI